MLEVLSNKPKHKKWHIPALGRMILSAIESENDELIRGIELSAEPAWQLEPIQDGSDLIGYWNGVTDDLDSGIDDLDFAIEDE